MKLMMITAAMAATANASDDPARPARYFVSAGAPMEVGDSAGLFAQGLDGDCTSLAAEDGAETARPAD